MLTATAQNNKNMLKICCSNQNFLIVVTRHSRCGILLCPHVFVGLATSSYIHVDPNTYAEAISSHESSEWRLNNIWRLVPLPHDRKLVASGFTELKQTLLEL